MEWWGLVLAALLGLGTALWLGRRRYRYDDDVVHHTAPGWLSAGTVFLGALLAVPFALDWSVARTLTYLLAWVWAVALMVIDLDVRRLPDRLTLPAYPAAAVLLTLCSWAEQRWEALAWAAACAGGAVLVYLVLALIAAGSEGLGLGDVKLAGVLGGLLGWLAPMTAVLGLLTGFILGGVIAAVLLLSRRAGRRSYVSYGPVMVLGAYPWVLLGTG